MGRTWEGHGKNVFMSGLWGNVRTWEGHGETWKERVLCRRRDMEMTWEEHGETWIVVTCGMWGDVITWEEHGETWEGHGKNTETQEERVLWGHARREEHGKNRGRT